MTIAQDASRLGAEAAPPGHVDQDRTSRVAMPATEPLTDVEQRILTLLGQRKTNQAIAGELYMSKRSLEYRLTEIFKKLGVRRKSELLRDRRSTTHNPKRHATSGSQHESNGSEQPAGT